MSQESRLDQDTLDAREQQTADDYDPHAGPGCPHARFVLDPATPSLHADNDRLRAAGPLVPVTAEGVPAWAATRYATLLTVLTHPNLSRDIRHWATRDTCPAGTAIDRIVTDTSMLNAEGDDHRRLRTPVAGAFTARRLRQLRPKIEALTDRLVDALAELPPDEPVDLRKEFAYPLPREVISELIGIPAEHQDALHELSDAVAQVSDTLDDSPDVRRALHELLDRVIEERRDTPGEDLITDLFRLREKDGDRLSSDELFATIELLFIAGHVTTVNLITNAIGALLNRPDQLELLRTGQCDYSAAVEETLRWDSPIAYFPMRYAVQDIEIDGVRLRTGEPVLACFAATGRDPGQFGENADRFDITNPPSAHLAFGHGPHFCLGAPLARIEAEIALKALFEAFPEIAPAARPEDLAPLDTLLGNSTRSMPVLLGPRAR
ncbi:cytochrome P450 [Nonomuraea angiospora]|uniref:Cytochrome P450 n=1 Tax=Nonomuraea angiospora TaxID=46172 RepID=A0ABR9LSK8_9ACTN|nr:cytochrome P450 [Nonomuraea angiospora]MBE1583257.1 cytochrome P450 [Nonomuraea angiospora]MDX3110959.1 cytochrome P450 [Nonomuraea angiospora]